MEKIGWRFPPLSGGTRQGYTNNDIEVFKGEELIDNLAREICQNSLDAKIDGISSPVRVVFEVTHFNKKEHKVFTEFQSCIDGCRKYWGSKIDKKLKRFLDDADEMLKKEKIPVLIASDYNTRGLRGAKTRELNSPWEALTGADGISVKNDETSGGSFGIGKNAPFACSALSMVFYNTFAEDNVKSFVGVARLATLYQDGKETQRVGKYQKNDNENERWLPLFERDRDSFKDAFHRNSKGTDVIIAGFNQEHDWMDLITKAVIKNFFVAICENKLVVEIKLGNFQMALIDKAHIAQIFISKSNEKDMQIPFQLFQAFRKPDVKKSFSILDENDIEIFVRSDASYKRTVADFRDTGMLIRRYSKQIFQHYAAVLVIRGENLGKLLLQTEPPRHNRWDYRLISQNNKELRNKAKNALNDIDVNLLELLKSQFETVSTTSIDAVGVGEYLPDEEQSMGETGVGDDILRPKIKIGKFKIVKPPIETEPVEGGKGEGTEDEGETHNNSTNPNPIDPEHLPPVSKGGDQTGVVPKPGPKIIPSFKIQRAFPTDFQHGMYKVVICPENSYNDVYISFFAVGEDGNTDALDIESFSFEGNSIPVINRTAGPVKLVAKKIAQFSVKISSSEKLALSLKITEDARL